MNMFFYRVSVFAAALFCAAGVSAAARLPVYEVTVAVECASPDAARNAGLNFLPLPPGKKAAFSCRWDDNNMGDLIMKRLMHKYGYKGTFFLLAPEGEFLEKVLPELCKDGFTIGNHTLHHHDLPLMTPNGVHREILAAGILFETLAGHSVTSFVFPNGKYQNRFYPDSLDVIVSSLRRAGILGGPDQPMYRLDRYFGKEFFNSGNDLIVPGDRGTSAARFDQHLKKALATAGKPPHLTLGIHVRHSKKDFLELEKSLKKYAARPDWWYCNENEFLAYSYMARHAAVTAKKVDGSKAVFTVALPRPEYLGSDVSLWAECGGRNIEIRHTEKVPGKIAAAGADGSTAGFPGLNMRLFFPAPDRIRFEAVNCGTPLKNVRLALRLSPDFKEETLYCEVGEISGKYGKEWQLTPAPAGKSAGTRLNALQVDFTADGKRSRIWVTHQEKVEKKFAPAAKVMGSSRKFTPAEVRKLSLPDTAIEPGVFPEAVNEADFRETVFRIPEKVRNRISLTVMMEFDGGREMRLQGDLPKNIFCNGEKLETANGEVRFTAPPGKCRVVFQHLNRRMSYRYIQLILTPVSK